MNHVTLKMYRFRSQTRTIIKYINIEDFPFSQEEVIASALSLLSPPVGV